MAKLTEEKIKAIQEAYIRLGTYSGVAKELGCSAATVKKYVASDSSVSVKSSIAPFEGEITPVEMIDFDFVLYEWTHLIDEEIREVKKLQEEM